MLGTTVTARKIPAEKQLKIMIIQIFPKGNASKQDFHQNEGNTNNNQLLRKGILAETY